jgi:hypothetical protein
MSKKPARASAENIPAEAPSTDKPEPSSLEAVRSDIAQVREEIFKVQRWVSELQLHFRRVLDSTLNADRSPKSTQPLFMRVAFQPALSDLVRAVGYEDLTIDQMREILAQLEATHGETKVQAILAEAIEPAEDGLWRLSAAVGVHAWQIIGYPKEHQTAQKSDSRSGNRRRR